jgi:hypothetical protein
VKKYIVMLYAGFEVEAENIAQARKMAKKHIQTIPQSKGGICGSYPVSHKDRTRLKYSIERQFMNLDVWRKF